MPFWQAFYSYDSCFYVILGCIIRGSVCPGTAYAKLSEKACDSRGIRLLLMQKGN